MAKITDKLDNINRTLEKMLEVMNKPDRLFMKILIICGLLAGISGIISEIDTVIKWFKEGIW
ncbi:MAG: hypothetical protein FWD13_02910 [Treponema sp.]|nr:hypothetical protein [Treponema sp.]